MLSMFSRRLRILFSSEYNNNARLTWYNVLYAIVLLCVYDVLTSRRFFCCALLLLLRLHYVLLFAWAIRHQTVFGILLFPFVVSRGKNRDCAILYIYCKNENQPLCIYSFLNKSYFIKRSSGLGGALSAPVYV